MKRISLTIITIIICFTAKSQYNNDIIIEQILKTDTNSIGQKINYPDFKEDLVTILKVTIPSGKSTGWHKHEIPVFAYIQKGTLTVEIEGNKTIQFSENSSFSEVLNVFHNGTNKGNEVLIIIAFYLGEKGKPLSVRKESD